MYWDAQCKDWETGFAAGLLHSQCFLPLLSYGATAPLAALPEERASAPTQSPPHSPLRNASQESGTAAEAGTPKSPWRKKASMQITTGHVWEEHPIAGREQRVRGTEDDREDDVLKDMLVAAALLEQSEDGAGLEGGGRRPLQVASSQRNSVENPAEIG